MRTSFTLALVLASTLAACSGDDGVSPGNEQEVITTLSLTMTPSGGGNPIVAELDDEDGDGGNPPTVDPITLPAGSYTVAVGFQNRLETPAEEITDEVRDEAVDHQVFFTGTAVTGPASSTANAPVTQSYTDTDDNGLPIGLANMFVTTTGTGMLTVTLRHMPPLNDQPVKTASAAADVKAGGLGAIGGETDATATFAVTIP